uniref:Secreted protein n=1 Tax=Pararge aegeria TaxID=116150 RepID=S4NSB2_9NEOP
MCAMKHFLITNLLCRLAELGWRHFFNKCKISWFFLMLRSNGVTDCHVFLLDNIAFLLHPGNPPNVTTRLQLL